MDPAPICPDCGKPVERDPFRGKPVGAKGFCIGFDRCHQDPIPPTPRDDG
jgi:hypothetical protein